MVSRTKPRPERKINNVSLLSEDSSELPEKPISEPRLIDEPGIPSRPYSLAERDSLLVEVGVQTDVAGPTDTYAKDILEHMQKANAKLKNDLDLKTEEMGSYKARNAILVEQNAKMLEKLEEELQQVANIKSESNVAVSGAKKEAEELAVKLRDRDQYCVDLLEEFESAKVYHEGALADMEAAKKKAL